MTIEFCQKCLLPQNMRLSTSVREQAEPDGKIKKIKTRNYQCEVCHSFVRGEEFELTGDDSSDGAATTVAGN